MIVINKYRLCNTVNGIKAVIICPKCNELLGIFNHTILNDGTVTPSVVDEQKVKLSEVDLMCVCGFHDFIKLENWPNSPEKLEL